MRVTSAFSSSSRTSGTGPWAGGRNMASNLESNAPERSWLTMPRKFFRKSLPDPDEVLAKRGAAPFRRWLGHPNLWCLNRRSVSGAVAIGLFCGLIPGPFQMLGALLLAIPLRKNIPVALIVTLYTNPLTIVPLYVIAFEYGRLLLGLDHAAAGITPFAFDWSDWPGSMRALGDWML